MLWLLRLLDTFLSSIPTTAMELQVAEDVQTIQSFRWTGIYYLIKEFNPVPLQLFYLAQIIWGNVSSREAVVIFKKPQMLQRAFLLHIYFWRQVEKSWHRKILSVAQLFLWLRCYEAPDLNAYWKAYWKAGWVSIRFHKVFSSWSRQVFFLLPVNKGRLFMAWTAVCNWHIVSHKHMEIYLTKKRYCDNI